MFIFSKRKRRNTLKTFFEFFMRCSLLHNKNTLSSSRMSRGRRISANWTSTVHPQPFINALRMEAMFTLRYAPKCILGIVIHKAYWASDTIRPREASTFSDNYFCVGFNNRVIKASYNCRRLWCYCSRSCGCISSCSISPTSTVHQAHEA